MQEVVLQRGLVCLQLKSQEESLLQLFMVLIILKIHLKNFIIQ